MKHRKLRLDEDDFKVYLLELYVDNNGQKCSVRKVWSNEEFMNHTGMFKINKYTGERERVSEGTMSYYNKKLSLNEESLFEYHQKVTKRIPPTIAFEEWSRRNNRGYSKEEVNNQDTIKRKMMVYFDITGVYEHFTPNKVATLIESIYGKEAIQKFYEQLTVGGTDG